MFPSNPSDFYLCDTCIHVQLCGSKTLAAMLAIKRLVSVTAEMLFENTIGGTCCVTSLSHRSKVGKLAGQKSPVEDPDKVVESESSTNTKS